MQVWQPTKMLLTPGTRIYDDQSSVKSLPEGSPTFDG